MPVASAFPLPLQHKGRFTGYRVLRLNFLAWRKPLDDFPDIEWLCLLLRIPFGLIFKDNMFGVYMKRNPNPGGRFFFSRGIWGLGSLVVFRSRFAQKAKGVVSLVMCMFHEAKSPV